MALPSISRRLVVSVAVPLVLFFGATILMLDQLYRQLNAISMAQRLDEQIVALMSAVDVDAEGRIDVRLLDPASRWSTPVSGYYAEVSSTDGQPLWQSPSLAGAELDLPLAVGSGELSGTADSAAAGSVDALSRRLRWEVTPGSSRDLVFTVAQTDLPTRERLQRFRSQLTGWFAAVTLVLLAVIGWLLRRALEPVRRLEAELREIESGERQQLGGAYPRELAGVTRGLNALLVSERERIRRYRETLGNLAHGLKTPLAVMRAAMAGERDPRAALDAQIDRIATIVDHQLARAATSGSATLGQRAVAVAPIVQRLCDALRKVHADRRPEFELDVPAGIGFLGDAEDLTEALGNLADNACKYGRGRVYIGAHIEAQRSAPLQLVICVGDNGPGIADRDRQRVLDRGARIDESEPGHGLGLAMVRDTAHSYGGSLSILTCRRLGGAGFELVLPGRLLGAA